jgi:hypothetical protein
VQLQRAAPERLVAEGVEAEDSFSLLEEPVGGSRIGIVVIASNPAHGQVHRHEAEVEDQPGAHDERQPPKPLGDHSHPRPIVGRGQRGTV